MAWRKWNPNPVRNAHAGDCVIRAITRATGKGWDEVYWQLCDLGAEMGDWGNSNTIWRRYLRELGFSQYALPNTCPDCYTVRDFARDNPSGSYILSVGANGGNHVVAVVSGDWWDAWDSANEVIIYYYRRV